MQVCTFREIYHYPQTEEIGYHARLVAIYASRAVMGRENLAAMQLGVKSLISVILSLVAFYWFDYL
jgi:hypothetical protein